MTLPPMPTPAGNPSMRSAGGAIRTLLITGVSRGLGKALALELAKRGHYIIGCARSQDKLNAFQTELASSTNPPSENKHLLMSVDVVILYFIFALLLLFTCELYLHFKSVPHVFLFPFDLIVCFSWNMASIMH